MKKVVFICLLGLFLAAAIPLFTYTPTHQIPANGPGHLPQQTKYIALTFDDGPQPTYTDRIVDALSQYGAKGTFFVVGSRISDHLPQLRHIRDSG
ncbi:MAG: polysaccharide deacetylase family protein, partial [Clostridia bacterium]|nr:polysaccharide deacetylase family protein [Clostridia bacterium]